MNGVRFFEYLELCHIKRDFFKENRDELIRNNKGVY